MSRRLLAVPWLLAAGLALAQAPSADGGRRLIEQKVKLLEMLVSSQAAKAQSAGTPPSERLERSGAALIQARQALAADRLEEAGQILDTALRSSASASAGATPAGLSEDARRNSYQNLVEQVATYRASVEDLAAHPRSGRAARELLARLDGKSADARRLAAAGNLEAANRSLGEAYQLAVSELSRLRAGEEVVLSLSFASPAEEFAYEIRRFESNEILVAMMIRDGKADGDRRAPVEALRAEGRRLRGEAEQLAHAGRHRDAVALMEQAVGQLNRALQAMGLPVF